MSKKVCFIGHREVLYSQVKERLILAIKNEIDSGCRFFTMGTHGEFDSLALAKCRKFRNIYKDIEIEVVLTSYHKVENKLLESYKNEDGEIKMIHENFNFYDDVKTIMYDIEDIHFKKQITESNKQMINGCDTIICYVDEKKYKSGAKTAMNYAKKQGLKIINIYDEKDNPTYGMTEEEKKTYFEKLKAKISNKK